MDCGVGGKTLWERVASHLMERSVLSFGGEASCHDLAEGMVKENFGGVPIVNSENRLIGIVTEFDLLKFLLRRKDLKKTTASEIMSPPVSISEEMTAEEIVALLQARHLIRVPVVDGEGKLVGMVAGKDILAGYIESTLGLFPGL
jgi:CBS domain-containing protein